MVLPFMIKGRNGQMDIQREQNLLADMLNLTCHIVMTSSVRGKLPELQ